MWEDYRIMLDDFKAKPRVDAREQEIIFSKAIKAGKRIYYLDVKRNRKDDLFVAITESKKIVSGYDDETQVSYEKHKIFLYKEDFDKFVDGLEDVIKFIRTQSSVITEDSTSTEFSSTDFINTNIEAPGANLEFNIEEFEK